MESNPSYATTVQVDVYGNWQHVIPNDLPTGTRHIIIQDEEGNEQTLLLDVDRSSSATSPIVTESKTIHNDQFPFGTAGLLVGLGLVLIGLFIRSLILKGNVTRSSKSKRQKTGMNTRK